MAPLWLMTLYKDYEIKNDVIIFKENGNIVYEFPIPKNFILIGIIDYSACGNGYIFMFSKYLVKRPKHIPEGYTNLTLSSEGLYKVESEEPFLYSSESRIHSKRELYYMDTSYITPDDFKLACNGRYSVTKEDIPKSFWFSIQYRALMNEFYRSSCNKYRDWFGYNEIMPYIKAFDLRSRLINEYELITILAYNKNGKYEEYLVEDSIYENFMRTDKIIIGGAWVNVENFFKIVSSVENPNVFLFVNCEPMLHRPFCDYTSHPIYQNGEQNYPWFAIPVVEESEQNIHKLKL